MGKTSRKLANGQNIDYFEKKNGPRASSAPALGLNTIIFKHVYWYMQQISGERLYRIIGPFGLEFHVNTMHRHFCKNALLFALWLLIYAFYF